MKLVRAICATEAECASCVLRAKLHPVEGCILIERRPAGAVDPRNGKVVEAKPTDWTTHPNNPMARVAAE